MDWDVCAHGYGLAEAPTIAIDGSLVFSDVLGGGVYRIGEHDEVTTVVPKRRGVGGIAIHEDRGIVCSGRDSEVPALGRPDGRALDEQGAIGVALGPGGIARLTPDGDTDGGPEPPSAFTTSLCFAGRDLYVTTGGHSERAELRGCVLRTTVGVAGAPVTPAAV